MTGPGDTGGPVDVTAPEAATVAARRIAELTGRTPIGAVSVAPSDEGWSVEVEVVEDRRIPSSSDILAIYVVALDLDGELLSYRRIRQYMRGRDAGGAER
ncbi:gas vesicle protein GvpO [Rhodococcus sp. SGAir0479]|uniref:gas vesicle protein GvpO n=1 Tax=Rhodococcus sp. SGAir0479 TaxID=2567884 RepID=UPI0010CD381F|nr:gas vesicle protein [Rhodococcus sp. SGAir0479]QCQ91347.1 gas vesicle protein [Rhodococcus sp. SGAir0479]